MRGGEGGLRWFCVHTKARAEAQALEHLSRQQFACFLPRIRQMASGIRKRESKARVEPLFPRYLFLQADPLAQDLAPVRSTRGVLGLVRFADQLAQVPDDIIGRLKQDTGPDGVIEPMPPSFQPGDGVGIVDGPLAGLRGAYAHDNGQQRAIVLLHLLGAEQRVAVPLEFLQPLGAMPAG
ncbi:MAG: transcription termination/antitermination NusG family protein [Burkholderiaceae bacterium]